MKNVIKKICMCGDAAVGKTSLIRRFIINKYDDNYISTLGTVVKKKIVNLPHKNHSINMQIWDISGQAEFKRIHASAFRHADGALAVWDVTRPETARNIHLWINNLFKYSRGQVPVVILANKDDLVNKNLKFASKIRSMLEHLNYPILTTSAKSGFNVELAFQTLGEQVIENPIRGPKTVVDLVAMPEIFENPHALMDYFTVRFANIFGDEEIGMHMIRTQIEAEGINFRNLTSDDALKMIDRLVDLVSNMRGEDEAKALRKDYKRAYNRCNW